MRSPANSLSSAANSFEAGLRVTTRKRSIARTKKVARIRGSESFGSDLATATGI